MPRTTSTCKRPRCTRVARDKHGYCEVHAALYDVQDTYVLACRSRLALRLLKDAGLSQHAIGAATKIKPDTIAKILRGQKTVRRSTERKILADTSHTSPVTPPQWPTARRLQSLQAAGITLQAIASATGYDPSTLSKVMTGKRTYVSPGVTRAVAEFYEAHKADPVRKPAHAAVGKPWPTPMWWDDIDDPNEQPGVNLCLDCHSEINPVSSFYCSDCRNRRWNAARYRKEK